MVLKPLSVSPKRSADNDFREVTDIILGTFAFETDIRRRLKRSKRNLPVIGLTASFQHADLKFYLNIGMNTCLGKPVRLETLKKSVESVASRCASGLSSDDSEISSSADGSTSSVYS